MTELSLNILDIANNSIRAGAQLIEIEVRINRKDDTLSIQIADNGCGLSKEQLANVEDPFFTTRTTRTVGLGIPFFKQEALDTGGSFHIKSDPGIGTTVTGIFGLSHIDRMPLGDINSTIYTLIITNTTIDFMYSYELDASSFNLDTRIMRDILCDIPFHSPQVAIFIKDYLKENQDIVDDGYHA